MSARVAVTLWDELGGEPRPRTGIYGRELLPSPTYDHCFELYRGPAGECRCRMKRDGSIRNDMPDWFETVPAPEGWSA